MQALVVLTAFVAVWLTYQQANQVDCNARYNERSARSQQAREAAADADRKALNTLVRSLVDDNTSDGREQVQRYLEAIERTDLERERNPVPAPPPDLCK